MDRDDLEHLLKSNGLGRFGEAILSASEPSVRLISHRDKQSPPDVGVSKLGGCPDLPSSTPWPERSGRPLSFIAQINLGEMPLLKNAIRKGGLLSFFFDAEEQPWGFDPKDSDGFVVLYFPQDEQLSRRETPEELEDEGWFLECHLEPREHLSIPGWEHAAIHALDMNEEESKKYDAVVDHFSPEYPARSHQLFGLPGVIQDSMELQCQLVTNGLYCGDSTAYNDPRRAVLEETVDEWRLLLQVDSDDDSDMMWGDAGRLYYWIRESDLKAMDFSAVWMILQCG